MARDLRRRREEAIRITTASSSRDAEISMRQRRYVVSMAIRTACFLGAILVGPGWVRWVLVAAAVLLPYVAVVLANVNASRSDGFELLDNEYGPHQLGGSTDSEGQPGPEVL
jgi:fatty acid desaturase